MTKFDTLPPLKKWVITSKYFLKTTDTKEKKVGSTHFLLDGGIWKIPLGEYQTFLRLLSADLQNGEKHYICENRSSVFKFICDIDLFEDSVVTIDQISRIVNIIQEIITEYFGEKTVIICGADSKAVTKMHGETGGFVQEEIHLVKSGFHLVWPKIWITVENAKKLRSLFIKKLIETYGERESYNTWDDVVDLAVYEDNGLRMVGCRKIVICKSCKNKKEFRETCQTCQTVGKIDEGRVYSPVSVIPENEDYLKTLKCDYFVQLLETSIYNYSGLPETEFISLLPVQEEPVRGSKKKVVEKRDETTTKLENFIHRHFKEFYSKIRIKKLTQAENKYFVEPDDNFCMNVNRNHSSSGIYFQVTQSGICQRCYCKKDTTDGRLYGPCTNYSSKEISLNKTLQTLLFGNVASTTKRGKSKKINAFNLTRNSSTTVLDLGLKPEGNKMFTSKEICLENCKSILFQLEKELI
jgi:hypothetical protein